VPVVFFSARLFTAFSILIISSMMLFCGFIEDLSELNYLFNEGALSESILTNIVYFFMQPAMNGCLLVGLYWLFFIIFPTHRAGIVLRKTAFAFSESLQSFIGLHTHGCRAPPLYK
jgi:hypothetical protein